MAFNAPFIIALLHHTRFSRKEKNGLPKLRGLTKAVGISNKHHHGKTGMVRRISAQEPPVGLETRNAGIRCARLGQDLKARLHSLGGRALRSSAPKSLVDRGKRRFLQLIQIAPPKGGHLQGRDLESRTVSDGEGTPFS